MRDFFRQVLAALTHTGPGYDPAADREADLRTTLTTLAERWEQVAEYARAERAATYRTAASDLRDVLRTGVLPHPLMTDAELEQHGTPEEATR